MTLARLAPLLLVAAAILTAQPAPDLARLRAGVFLVATRDLGDPNFSNSVVLITRYDRTGAMGLIVNGPLELPLSRLFPSLPSQVRSNQLWEGGPVNRLGALALCRSRARLEGADLVIDGVYLVASRPLLEKKLAAGASPDSLRVYLGYSGWAPRQLENEVSVGAWRIVPATADLVFDPKPATLWQRLIGRTGQNIAALWNRLQPVTSRR
jgi:putative transcriptional regulator